VLKSRRFVLQLAFVSMAMASNALAQRAGGPGIEGVWNFNTMTPLERPAGVNVPTFTPSDATEFERAFFERGAERFPAAERPLQIDFNDTLSFHPSSID